MTDAERAIVLYQRKSGMGTKIRSVLRTVVLSLTLLLIGILGVPACILIGLSGIVWYIADTVIRRLDG